MRATRLSVLGLLVSLFLALLLWRVVFAEGWGEDCEFIYSEQCSGCQSADPAQGGGFVQVGTNNGYYCLTAEEDMECTYPSPKVSEDCVAVQQRAIYKTNQCAELRGDAIIMGISYFPCEHY